MVNKKYNRYLSKLFSSSILRELSIDSDSLRLREIVKLSGIMSHDNTPITFGGVFEIIYRHLKNNYKSEYVYKNIIANKILLGRHSLKTSALLHEFRTGASKADVLVLNGTSTVYEIKTEYDNLNRLEDQVRNYCKVFDKVYVVASEKYLKKVMDLIPIEVGVFVLTKRNTLSKRKKAKSNKNVINSDYVINSLRKNEVDEIINDFFGYRLNVPNTMFRTEARILFRKIPKEILHKMMVSILRERADLTISKEFISVLPQSLKFAGITTMFSREQCRKFQELLSFKICIS